MEITRARPGAPDSRHLRALCRSGPSPSLLHLLSRNGQLRKGEPRTGWAPARKAGLCSSASPAPGTLLLSSTPAAFSDGSQLVSLLTFKKVACCHLALCQGLSASLPPLLGQHLEPSAVRTGNPEGLGLNQSRQRALQQAQNWGAGVEGRLPLSPRRKGGFVNANILPELCV